MSARSLVISLTKDIKRFIWINTILLSFVISAFLVSFDHSLFYNVVAIPLFGVLLGVGNHLFINSYFMRKAESEIMMSFEKLQESILFDDLTEIYNRRSGMIRLREEFARSKRNPTKLSIAMVDIDNFKKINDSYGHQAGDFILKHVASSIKIWLREQDVVFRYGGEEFLIILPDTDDNQTFFPLDRLRQRISNEIITYGDSAIRTSISIGVATTSGGEESEAELIYRADQALYVAKRSGRNRVSFHKEEDTVLDLVARH